MKHCLITIFFIFLVHQLSAQWMSINNTGALPHSTATLDISATNKGILIPRLTQTERLAIPNPATGLLVYQTTADTGFQYFNGIKWLKIIDAIYPIADALTAADTAYWNSTLSIETDGDSTNELELPTIANPGDMAYWNGSNWVTIAASANDSATLQFVGGVPTWVGGSPSYPDGTVHCSGPTAVVEVTNPTTGKIWMDRNLGASQAATSSTDTAAYGDLYQWGRSADGHQCRTSTTTSTLSSTDNPGHGSFILVTTSPTDWRSPQNDNLWQGVNGINNPCPNGFRLPTESELNAERLSWSNNNAVGAFNSPLKLPLAGLRILSNGLLSYVNSFGYYWSSTVNSTFSRFLYFSSIEAYTNSLNRADGFSVRCIKD